MVSPDEGEVEVEIDGEEDRRGNGGERERSGGEIADDGGEAREGLEGMVRVLRIRVERVEI